MSSEPADQSQSSFPIVGVGASAGGLAQILGRATSLPVREVTNNQPVQADHVYVIPPGTNLSLAQGVLKLQPRQRSRTPHRPIGWMRVWS